MVWNLGKFFSRGENENKHPEDEIEPKEEKPVWRTTPEPERVAPQLNAAQQEAIDTADLRARAILEDIDSLRKIKQRGGARKGVSVYDAGRIKAFSGYVEVFDHGTPEAKVEAAIRVLDDCGKELMEKHARALERLHNIDLVQSDHGATPGIVETVNSIGEEIEKIEADLADIKMAVQTLAGRT